MAFPIALILQAALGAGQLIAGASQKKKAKRDAENNQMPPYTIPQLYADNVGLAEQRASYGFSPAAIQAFNQASQQSLMGASGDILRGGGSINEISKLYGVENANRQKLLSQDQTLRDNALQNLIDQRGIYAGQEITKWRLNYFDRWKDKAVAAATLMNQGNSLMSGGLSTLAGAGSQFGQMLNTQQVPKPTNQQPKTYDFLKKGEAVNSGNQYQNWFQTGDWFQTPELYDPNQYNTIPSQQVVT